MNGQHNRRSGSKEEQTRGVISGTVVDENTQRPLEYATVVLIHNKSQKEMDGSITSSNGKFKFFDVPGGNYTLSISFIGYAEKRISNIQLTRKKPDYKAGKIRLEASGLVLDEIEVVEEKKLIEHSIDKISFNAEKDPSLIGGDATDVLRKVPLLSLDIDGNVSLRGSSNVQILINGKPSSMFANNTGDALQMFPADQIKKVEVITSPGAKYDAEGTAGIINIITKKNELQGISGRVGGHAGNRQSRLSSTLNAAKGRFGSSINGSLHKSYAPAGTNFMKRIDVIDGQQRIFNQEGSSLVRRIGYWGQGEAYYDINGYKSINSSISWRGRNRTNASNLATTFDDAANQIFQDYQRNTESSNARGGYTWTTNYLKTYDQKGREFSIGLQLDGSLSNNDVQTIQESQDPTDNLNYRENSVNEADNLEFIAQVDYAHPLKSGIKFETGAKGLRRAIISDYYVEQYNDSLDLYILQKNRSDRFNYNQDVYAAYGSVSYDIHKWGFLAGIRFEQTRIGGFFKDFPTSFSNNYNNWIPNFAISRSLVGYSKIKLSYTQRIQRPSLRYINPYVNDSDRRNLIFGNPELQPELTHQMEVSYNNFFKGTSIFVSMYYKFTNDVIDPFIIVNSEGVSSQTYYNIGIKQTTGINLFSSIKLNKILNVTLGLNGSQINIQGQQGGITTSNIGYVLSGHGNASLTLPKDLAFEIFAFGRSPRVTTQGTNANFWMTSFSLKKTFWKKSASLGITIVDPFWENKYFRNNLSDESGFSQISEFSIPFRSFGLKFSYKFGKLKFKPKKRSSKIKNDDLLKGGDPTEGGS